MNIRVFQKRRMIAATALAAIALALCIALHATGAYAVFSGGTVRKLPIYSVERADKKIAITFDCAWGTEHTDAILQALARENVHATFFMVEFWTEKYPEYVQKIDEAGHAIGTHSATHSQMSKQSEAQIRSELESSSAAITAVTGKKVDLFRAPFGDYDDELINTAEQSGYFVIQWDVDSLDWKDLSASDIAMRIINRVQPGSIILMHNNGLHTAESLPLIISALKNRGYEFSTIGGMIYRSDFTLDSQGRQQLAS